DYLSTMADGFEMPTEWRDAVVDDGRRRFRGDEQWFLARVGAEPAAVATLGGGATVPGHRRTGCHLAPVRHRPDVAHLLGCTHVIGGASYGSGSFRNQLRGGLRLAYIESGWRRVGTP